MCGERTFPHSSFRIQHFRDLFPKLSSCCVAVRYYAHDFRIGSELSIDCRFATHALHARTDAHRSHFQQQGVARHYGPTKPRFLDASKKYQFLVSILDLAQRQYSANLCESFDNKHAGIPARPGQVHWEKGFVRLLWLDAPKIRSRGHQFDNPINQQERITVRQELLDCERVENGFHEEQYSQEVCRNKKRGNAEQLPHFQVYNALGSIQ